jgi:acetyl-CoA acetyltransferase family protein
VAGGVESMTRSPYVTLKSGTAWDRATPQVADTTLGWRFVNPRMPADWIISLGQTAEKVARLHGISRAEQDAFAAESQRRAQAAIAAGHFAAELVPVPVTGPNPLATADEHPRAGVTVEGLAKLSPAFAKGGTATAGNSSGINDGASALGVASAEAVREHKLSPMARIIGTAVAGVDPSCMGLGPIPATQKLLARLGMSVKDLDLVELNEAFAAQAIPCIRELGLDPARVNVSGGAIALGHPLGASGARMATTLVHALRRTGGRYGLATMCIGVGQGIAMVLERTE